jgi:hypothetical protein
MVLEQKDLPEQWERKMLDNCPVEGLLAANPSVNDGKLQIWYDITGKQSLDVALETEKLRYELLCRIMMALYQIAEKLEERLLDTQGIVLAPEAIYIDGLRENVYFCYYPGSDKSGIAGFESLMESILPYVDHSDEKCTSCAYKIYEEACKDGFGLALLKDIVHLAYEKEYTVPEEGYEPEQREIKENYGKYGRMGETGEVFPKRKPVCDTESPGEKKMFPGWLKRGGRATDCEPQQQSVGLNNIGMPGLDARRFVLNRFKRRKKQDDTPFVFEPEYMDTETKNPTVLLGDLNRRPEGLLLYEGTGRGQDIKITEDSTTIGSDRGLSGYIPGAAVSRHHARIYKDGDTYYIEDLNSSNGTYIDGTMLDYRQKIELKKNQTVRFADEKYRFI